MPESKHLSCVVMASLRLSSSVSENVFWVAANQARGLQIWQNGKRIIDMPTPGSPRLPHGADLQMVPG